MDLQAVLSNLNSEKLSQYQEQMDNEALEKFLEANDPWSKEHEQLITNPDLLVNIPTIED